MLCICKNEHEIVGHVPYNIARVFSHFLQRDCNKGFVAVTGSEVNRGARYGLEIPSIYRLYGPKPYTDRIKEIANSLHRSDFFHTDIMCMFQLHPKVTPLVRYRRCTSIGKYCSVCETCLLSGIRRLSAIWEL